MNEENKKKLNEMLKEFEKDAGIKIPDNMLEDSEKINKEAEYFVDYLDARFEMQKFPEAYRLPMYMVIFEKIAAIMVKKIYKDPQLLDELIKDAIEGAKMEIECNKV